MATYDDTFGSSSSSTGGSFRTLTAFYDERDDAEEAVSRLRTLGLPEASVRMVGGGESSGTSSYGESSGSSSSSSYSSGTSSYSSSGHQGDHKGFWDSLADFFFPDEDRATYAEGLRRGGYLVTVSSIPDALYDQALDILDDEGSVDVDSRASEWRNEGWTGSSSYAGSSSTGSSSYSDTSSGLGGSLSGTGGTMGMGAAATGAGLTGSQGSSYESSSTSGSGLSGLSSTGSTTGMSDTSLRGDTETIPVVEESLRIGKRDVNLGRVRVRSYVVEQPVQEQVNLREERVVVERRPVDRPLSGTENAFTDRVIEAEEHAEEAVVAKEARVREEIAVRKEAQQHTETVSDTVRRTEVEVEDERTGNRLSGDARVNEDRNR